MEKEIRILILEDVPNDAELAQYEIHKCIKSCLYKVVDNDDDFMIGLKNFVPDVIISDYNLPGFDGLTALKLTQQHAPTIPFIIFTGSQNEDIAVSCMKAGATDYVIKEHVKRLGPAVEQALEKKKAQIEKRRMEQELIISERKYKTIFDNIQDVYYETAIDGTILELSPSVVLTGFTREELIGENMMNFYASQEERTELLKSIYLDGQVVDHEVTLKDKHGKTMDISITAKLMMNEDGTQKIAGTMRDISERAKLRQELIAAKEKAEEMNRLKSFFLANMSHELRTPLSGILGFSELLTNITTDNEANEMVALIHKSGKRLLTTLNSILDLSRIEANKTEIHWQAIDLYSYLEDRIKNFKHAATSKGLELKLIDNQKDISLCTDTGMLEHIINAIVENAVKFTEYGEIDIIVDQVLIDTKKWITIKVKDTGIGIDPEKRDVIFEPFRQGSEGYSRSYEGSGLGLTLAYKFIELLGGRLSLVETSEKGSTFMMEFPESVDMQEPEKTEEQQQAMKTPQPSAHEDMAILPKLLLVDDDEMTRIMVQLMLQSIYDIEFAGTGKQALMMIDETQYQIILLDINLKENISGLDIVRLLRKSSRYATTPIVAATAYTMLGDREKFLAEGFTEYLPKPFTKEDLIKIIQYAEKLI